MKITIIHRDIYGVDKMYVTDPVISAAVQTLTGCRTLREKDLDSLRALGHEIVDLNKVVAVMAN